MEIKKVVEEILSQKREDGGIRQVYFVGCGGSLGALYPAKIFIEKEASDIKTGWFNSNEFIYSTPKDFGKSSVLVIACHKGDTPETVSAAKYGREKGATVIVLTWLNDSPIISHSDYVIKYSFGENRDISAEKTLSALLIAAEFLQQIEGYENYEKLLEGLSQIDLIVKSACRHVEKRALAFAKEYREDKVIYTMGSGAGYGAAYMESICIFMEMQWINSSSIHTGEYFHGPFEITDAEIPFMIQVSEGSTRPLDERALVFLKKYGKRIEVLDAKELGLSTIDLSVVDYFNHTLFNNIYPVYNRALADERKHPLSTRRYMWKVEY